MVDNRLTEQEYGIYEGVNRNNKHFQNNKMNFEYRYPQCESMTQVAHKIYEFLEQVKKYKN